MRVLLWGEQFLPYIGGAELFAARLLPAMRQRGHDLAVVTSQVSRDLPARSVHQGVPVYRFPFRDALEPRRVDDLVRLRRQVTELVRGWDAILLTGVTPSAFFCLAAAETAHVPLLVRLNQEVGQRSSRADGKTLTRQVLETAAWVVAVSRTILAQWTVLAPAVAARSSVVYNGVEAPVDPPPAPPQRTQRLLCLGRLIRKKGFDVALDAFALLLRRWPGARMIVAGDGPERAALQAQAVALGLGTQVEFRGWVAPDDVPALISDATLVLIPSRVEGLPAVALQAAAAGRPVVGTRCGGMPEAVEDGRAGLLTDLDAGALAAAVAALLERPDTAAQMGLAAWRRARRLFSQERCMEDYDTLLRRVVPTSTRGMHGIERLPRQ